MKKKAQTPPTIVPGKQAGDIAVTPELVEVKPVHIIITIGIVMFLTALLTVYVNKKELPKKTLIPTPQVYVTPEPSASPMITVSPTAEPIESDYAPYEERVETHTCNDSLFKTDALQFHCPKNSSIVISYIVDSKKNLEAVGKVYVYASEYTLSIQPFQGGIIGEYVYDPTKKELTFGLPHDDEGKTGMDAIQLAAPIIEYTLANGEKILFVREKEVDDWAYFLMTSSQKQDPYHFTEGHNMTIWWSKTIPLLNTNLVGNLYGDDIAQLISVSFKGDITEANAGTFVSDFDTLLKTYKLTN